MSSLCDNIKGFFHRHTMEKVAHWCDKECSIVITEYKCTSCDHEAWDFVYFDDSRCKVLKRVPISMSAHDATKFVECGEPTCDRQQQRDNDKTKKTSEVKSGRRHTDTPAKGGRKTAKESKPKAAYQAPEVV